MRASCAENQCTVTEESTTAAFAQLLIPPHVFKRVAEVIVYSHVVAVRRPVQRATNHAGNMYSPPPCCYGFYVLTPFIRGTTSGRGLKILFAREGGPAPYSV